MRRGVISFAVNNKKSKRLSILKLCWFTSSGDFSFSGLFRDDLFGWRLWSQHEILNSPVENIDMKLLKLVKTFNFTFTLFSWFVFWNVCDLWFVWKVFIIKTLMKIPKKSQFTSMENWSCWNWIFLLFPLAIFIAHSNIDHFNILRTFLICFLIFALFCIFFSILGTFCEIFLDKDANFQPNHN